ncbi:hypothetical protein EES43_20440 [Streptomyces sp. ADI96-02]|nr:hypothetical protein EES43_20440 [Streptomyces sp. ADI96-02]
MREDALPVRLLRFPTDLPDPSTWFSRARSGAPVSVITSAATLVDVVHPRIDRTALEWTLSRLVMEPITEPHAPNLLWRRIFWLP